MAEQLTIKCPQCGSEMVKRNGKYGEFYGCRSFPRCRETRSMAQVNHMIREIASAEPKPKMVWSSYQKAIFELAENLESWKHLVIKAGPGSGKTTVGVEFAARLPKHLRIAFVAFNTKIAKTFALKLPPHVAASTLHSLGLSNCKNTLGKGLKVEERKVYYIIRDIQSSQSFERAEIIGESISSITKLISLLKGNLMEPTVANLEYCSERWDIELNGDKELIFETAIEAFSRSIKELDTIDFDDMIYLCAIGRVSCKKFDILVIDETQDLNKANLELVIRSISDDGHIVAVGDEHQSIYGFRGADADAMHNMIERLEAKILPLSISYRLPKSGVRLCNTLFPELEAAPDAKEGIVGNVSEYQFLSQVKAGDLVLCRTNAPLVAPCFDLIRQGKKAVILGRDIGNNLMSLVKKIQKRNQVIALSDILEAMVDYRRIEMGKLLRAEKELQAQLLDDKVETIIALADGCLTVGDLERKISRVFADNAEGVTFSTVHKAKGGEADNVYILHPELLPHPKAQAGWQMVQEENIMLVALSRHKEAIYFVK